MQAKFLRTFLKDCQGTTIIEFAVVGPIFLMLLMAALEIGLVTYTQIALETAVAESARQVIMVRKSDAGCNTECQFRQDLKNRTAGLINSDNIAVTSTVVGSNGSGAQTVPPDVCLTSPPSTPSTCASNVNFIDNNGNGRYDAPGGVNTGSEGDNVQIFVTLPWPVQFPLLNEFAKFTATQSNGQTTTSDGVFAISSNIILKNE